MKVERVVPPVEKFKIELSSTDLSRIESFLKSPIMSARIGEKGYFSNIGKITVRRLLRDIVDVAYQTGTTVPINVDNDDDDEPDDAI